MHLLIKWYYWYKNLGDELILFSLLNWADERFNPTSISIECWDNNWIESWIIQHKDFLIPWIIKKLEFLPIPSRKEKIQLCLWKKKWLYDLIIFWWWEVIDESRDFLHRWWNLYFQYKQDIKHWNTILVWWLWTNHKPFTKYLQKFLIKNSQIIILRDQYSFNLTKDILESNWDHRENKAEYDWDLTLPLLEEAAELFKEKEAKWKNPYYLINCSPLCNNENCIKKIKEFADLHKTMQAIYIACNKYEDSHFFQKIQEIIPDCEYFDWTQHHIADTLKLFYFADSWIWARLHFLYILKFFKKPFEKIHSSHKIEINLSDLDNI